MIPIRHSPDIRSAKDIRHFRSIHHSIRSKRLFGDMDGSLDVELPPWSGKLSDLDWLAGSDWGGHGRIETALIGKKLDEAAQNALLQLDKGSFFQSLLGKMFRGLYMRLRGNIIRFLLKTLYKVLVVVLSIVYSVLWRVLITPLMVIASLLLLVVSLIMLL